MIALACVLSARLAAAAAAPAVSLDTVRVEADRLTRAEELLRAPGFGTALAVPVRAPLHAGLPGLLAGAPGIHVLGAGGPGAFATLSVRGSEATQVAVLVDGVPVRWNAFGSVNLSDLPFESLSRVEVYRGFSPMGLGASAAGAVNLVSDTTASSRGRVSLRGGSLGEREETGVGALRIRGWNARGTLGHEANRGDFSYPDDHGTPLDPSDDTRERRANNDLERWRQSVSLTRGRVGLSGYAFQAEQGLPGIGQSQVLRARYKASGLVSHAFWRPRAGAADLLVDAAYTRGWQRFLDPGWEFKLGYMDTRSVDETLSGALSAVVPLSERAQLAASLAHHVEHWSPEFVAPRRAARGGNRAAGSAELESRLHGPRLEARAGARLEWNVDRGAGLTRLGRPGTPLPGDLGVRALPAAGISVQAVRGVWLKGSAALYQRRPTLAERFGIEGSQVGNDTLRAEHGRNFDLGTAGRARVGGAALEWDAARFWGRVREGIVLSINSQRTSIPQNIGRVAISGVESRLRVSAGGFAVEGGATWLRAVDDTQTPFLRGKQLPRRPEFECHGDVRWDLGFLEAQLDAQHYARNWLDRAHAEGLASRTLWAAGFGVPISSAGFLVRLSVDNLTDRQASDLNGYPLPGRTVGLSLDWNSAPAQRASN